MVDKVSRLVYICINDSIILVLEHKMIMAACARNMILQLAKPASRKMLLVLKMCERWLWRCSVASRFLFDIRQRRRSGGSYMLVWIIHYLNLVPLSTNGWCIGVCKDDEKTVSHRPKNRNTDIRTGR
jgi:hypothetical protein